MGNTENGKSGWRRPLLLLLSLCAACRSDYQVRRENLGEQMPWLRTGATLQADIVQRLGEPARQLENGRIQIWTLEDDLQPRGKTPYSYRYLREFRRVGPLSLV